MRSKFSSITLIASFFFFFFAREPIFYKLSDNLYLQLLSVKWIQLKNIFSHQKFLALKLKETMKIIAFKLHAHVVILVLYIEKRNTNKINWFET